MLDNRQSKETFGGRAAMTHRISGRARVWCALAALALVVAACGNADDDTTSGTTGKPSGTTFTGTNFDTHQTVDAPGVTDKEIHVGSVVSITNPTTAGSTTASRRTSTSSTATAASGAAR